MDLAELTPFVQLGASGVLLASIVWFGRYFIRLVSSGEWVPRRELDYTRADRDARLAEKDREIAAWRAVVDTERTRCEVVSEQNRTLVNGIGPTLARFFDALRALAAEGGGRYAGDPSSPGAQRPGDPPA